MGLQEYKKKRNFKSTPEPSAKKKLPAKKATLAFVIQKHDATHLHYDFRLEVNGTLKSWVLPKGPSLNPADKRLAIMVEDHPYDYRNFEGTIPKGNYGAGTVMIWDTGVYYPLDENYAVGDDKTMEAGIKKGKLVFALQGKKLVGIFDLIKLKSKDNENNWLMIKVKDSFVSTKDITKEEKSAVSDRSMQQIASTGDLKSVKSSEKPAEAKSANKKTASPIKKKAVLRKTVMPKKIKPMLANLTDKVFDGEDWLFEVKWDGFRAIAEVDNQKVQLYSRTFQSFNERFSPIVEDLKKLHAEAIFDGEIVVVDKQGKSSFQSLQNYQRSAAGYLRYYIFDLLYFKGRDLRDTPLLERKQILQSILPNDSSSALQYGDHIEGKGKKLFEEAEKNGLEGIIAKRKDSPYYSKRTHLWLKIKTHARQEAIICGFTAPRGSRQKFGALILGLYEEGKLKYIGHVGGGFSEEKLREVMKQLQPLITKKCPFAKSPPTNSPVTWVKPKLICEVSFSEWTKGDQMRQPIFVGMRSDKNPKEIKKEEPVPASEVKKAKAKPAKSEPEKQKKSTSKELESQLTLTHLDKIYWPKEKYTKGDLIEYYRKIAPYILPYLKDRPQSLRRFPNGIEQPGFFHKNMGDKLPDWLTTVPVKHSNEEIHYLLIQDMASLLYAVNLGCIDLNPFNSRVQHLNNPDYLILDLDPVKVDFKDVIETAQTIHEVLSTHDIPSYCKTSGGRGLHILLPLGARYSYEQAKQFAELIAVMVHERLPRITSIERSPSKRQGRVYLDYLQNNFGQTIAAPYCVRPKPLAPISTPLEWSEVKPGLDPTDFTIKNFLQRVKKKGDLFKPVLGKGIDLSKCLKKIQS